MYREHIEVLSRSLAEQSDPRSKKWWQDYVKESAPFLGVKMAAVRTCVHTWHRSQISENLDVDQQVELALALFGQAHTEEKLAGTLFLQEILMPAGALDCERDLPRFAQLFTEAKIYDWNVCDWFCVKVLGPLIKTQGRGCAEGVSAWRHAEGHWQARASLVPFVSVAEMAEYYPLILRGCRVVIRREERFAKTAVGWILRDISKYDRPFVEAALEENLPDFSVESLKNATRYFEKSAQRAYLQRLRQSLNRV